MATTILSQEGGVNANVTLVVVELKRTHSIIARNQGGIFFVSPKILKNTFQVRRGREKTVILTSNCQKYA